MAGEVVRRPLVTDLDRSTAATDQHWDEATAGIVTTSPADLQQLSHCHQVTTDISDNQVGLCVQSSKIMFCGFSFLRASYLYLI